VNKVPHLYLIVYRKLKEECVHTKELPTMRVLEIMKENFHNLPLISHYIILRELQDDYKLLVKINKFKFRIIYTDKDKELNNLNNLLF
jgi:hypothetical protein